MKKTFVLLALALGLPAAQATIQTSTTNVSFSDVQVGDTSAPAIVYITNTGNAPAQLNTSDSCPADLSVEGFCNLTLNPGGACSLQVTFTPRQEGLQSCTIYINDFRSGGSNFISVSGNGVK